MAKNMIAKRRCLNLMLVFRVVRKILFTLSLVVLNFSQD